MCRGSGAGGDVLRRRPSLRQSKTTLTLWQNYGTEQNAVATTNLVKAFEKLNPNITINVVAQPGTNYFQLLQSAAISGNGPDLAVMWTGIYDLQYSSYLVNLKGNVPAADLAKMEGLQWEAPNFDVEPGRLRDAARDAVLHRLLQQDAVQEGRHHLGADGLDPALRRLREAEGQGLQPMVYGNGGQAISTEFYPWYDMSYLMIGAHPLTSWKDLYDGTIPWTSSANVNQLKKWADAPKGRLHQLGRVDQHRQHPAVREGQGGNARRRHVGHRAVHRA